MIYSLQSLLNSSYKDKEHFLVVGNPIGHSLSPLMHNRALEYHSESADYLALNLLPNEIDSFAAYCNRESFRGCNITIPYKQQFLELVDHIDDSAKEIGAINTIVKESGSLVGFNTDLFGFMSPILDFADVISEGIAVVFGTGGASKAVLAGLIEIGVEEVVFVSRNPATVHIEHQHAHINVVGYSQWQAYADEVSILVNTTPVGMYPQTNHSMIEDVDVDLLEGKICYDLIYNPEMTKFLRQAESVNGVVVNGIEMFIQQGSKSFELWTGKRFPIDIIKSTLLTKLSE